MDDVAQDRQLPGAVYTARRRRWFVLLAALTPLALLGALVSWPRGEPAAPPGRIVTVAGPASVVLPDGQPAAWARILSFRFDRYGSGQRRHSREVPCAEAQQLLPGELLGLEGGEQLLMRPETVAQLDVREHKTDAAPPSCQRDHRPRQRYLQRVWALTPGQRLWRTDQNPPQLWPLDPTGAGPRVRERSRAAAWGFLLAAAVCGAVAWRLRTMRPAAGATTTTTS